MEEPKTKDLTKRLKRKGILPNFVFPLHQMNAAVNNGKEEMVEPQESGLDEEAEAETAGLENASEPPPQKVKFAVWSVEFISNLISYRSAS